MPDPIVTLPTYHFPFGTADKIMSISCTAALVTLAAANFDALVQFYQQCLTLEPTVVWPNRYAEFQLPQLRLGIFRPKEERITPNSSAPIQSGMAICLEVPNLEQAIAHLTHLGYPPAGTIQIASHGREIYVSDPEGNWLILHQSH